MKNHSPANGMETAAATPPRQLLLCKVADQEQSTLSVNCTIPVPRGSWIRFELASGGCWYGHGFAHRQPYPLNAEPIVNARFAVNNIQSPIWMCSGGYALIANTTQELEVRINELGSGWLEIRCMSDDIALQVFCGDNLPKAHQKLMAALHWPPPAPEKQLLGDSIFCTWTQYPRTITQERILAMAKEIRRQGYP